MYNRFSNWAILPICLAIFLVGTCKTPRIMHPKMNNSADFFPKLTGGMSKNHQKSAKTTPKPSKITGIIGSANFYFLRPKTGWWFQTFFIFTGK